MTRLPSADREPVTTNGTIAVANLHAQIAGLAARGRQGRPGQAAAPLVVATRAHLIDLLLLRGEVLGRIADYEQAAELAVELVHDAPDDVRAWLARARTRATFHRFVEAMADLETAGQHSLDRAAVDAERAPILQAVGCYWHALVLCEDAVEAPARLHHARCAGRAPGRTRRGRRGGAAVRRRAALLPGHLAVPHRLPRLPAGPDVARPG